MVLKDKLKAVTDVAAGKDLFGVIEVGVDSARLNFRLHSILAENVIKSVVFAFGEENIIVTPTYGRDDNGSKSDIVNVRLVDMGREDVLLAWLCIKDLLGEKYDVEFEQGLIRVKYIYG